MCLNSSRNNSDPEPRLRQRELGVLGAALQEQIRFYSGKAADRVPLVAGCKAGVPHEQRMRREAAELDHPAARQRKRGMARGHKSKRLDRKDSKLALLGLAGIEQRHPDIDF